MHTYGLPAIITNCSNNYGPYQFPEKLIPLMIANALQGKALPERYIFSMNLEPDRVFSPISKGTLAVIDDQFKYVIRLDSHQQWLYRYKTDQLEEHNLVGSEPDAARRLHDVLLAKLREVNERSPRKP